MDPQCFWSTRPATDGGTETADQNSGFGGPSFEEGEGKRSGKWRSANWRRQLQTDKPIMASCQPPPPRSPPAPPVPGPGGCHPLVPKIKKTHQCHIAQERNCETSLSELMCASFVLTHSTPPSSEKVPSRRCCALCPFCKGACAGCCARPFSPWDTRILPLMGSMCSSSRLCGAAQRRLHAPGRCFLIAAQCSPGHRSLSKLDELRLGVAAPHHHT